MRLRAPPSGTYKVKLPDGKLTGWPRTRLRARSHFASGSLPGPDAAGPGEVEYDTRAMSASPPPPVTVTRAASFIGVVVVGLAGAAAFLQPLPPGLTTPYLASGRPSAAASGPACGLSPPGYLRGRFFGGLDLEADWSGTGLLCDGMPKPDDAGVRLFFAGEQPGGGRVSVLIGIAINPAALAQGGAGTEYPANVTVIDEQAGRFFSSGGPGRCWAVIGSVTPIAGTGIDVAGHRVDGVAYCVGALPSLGDRSSLTLGEVRFAGKVGTGADQS